MHPDRGEDPAGRTAALTPDLSLTFVSDTSPLSVRAVLSRVRDRLMAFGGCAETTGNVELALAEVLNNICEHAYRGRDDGRIEIGLRGVPDGIAVEIGDHGRPMPAGQIPAGRQVSVDRVLGDLPEGGFGWNLIRQLTTDLAYERAGGVNRVRFTIPVRRNR
jgi:serine/threonine-protein kinase RsbW